MHSVYPVGSVAVNIIVSKTRVAPSKTLIIPRLELLGAVLLAQLGDAIRESLKYQYKYTYWIDSTAVLYCIANNKPWKQFVSNCEGIEICQVINRNYWRYCPG